MKKRLIIIPILTVVLLITSGCYEVNQVQGNKPQPFDIKVRTQITFRETNFTILILKNGTKIINSPDTAIFFDIQAVTPIGAKVGNHVPIYFSVDDFDTQIFKFNGAYQISWLIDNHTQFYVKGSKSVSYMKSYNLTLSFNLNLYELSKVTRSNATINFHDKEDLWSKQYNVTFIVVDG